MEFIIILIICIIILPKLYYYLLKKSFLREFNLDSFPKHGEIHRRRKSVQTPYYELNFPYWRFSNKDGTADKRRKDNTIYYPKSNLYISKYNIEFKNPVTMIYYINSLREHNITIQQHEVEKRKQDLIYSEKKTIYDANSIDKIISNFSSSPYDFEEFCANLYNKMGIQAQTTPATNDGGYDIMLNYKTGEKGIIECKCYNQKHSVGRPLIQKLVGANQILKAEHLKFITTSSYSQAAKEYAAETNVELIDGQRLLELIELYLNPKQIKLEVHKSEWVLNKNDLQTFIPSDIYPSL